MVGYYPKMACVRVLKLVRIGLLGLLEINFEGFVENYQIGTLRVGFMALMCVCSWIQIWCWFGVNYDVEVNVLDPFGVNDKWGGNREWVNGTMQKRVQRIYWNLVGSLLWVILVL